MDYFIWLYKIYCGERRAPGSGLVSPLGRFATSGDCRAWQGCFFAVHWKRALQASLVHTVCGANQCFEIIVSARRTAGNLFWSRGECALYIGAQLLPRESILNLWPRCRRSGRAARIVQAVRRSAHSPERRTPVYEEDSIILRWSGEGGHEAPSRFARSISFRRPSIHSSAARHLVAIPAITTAFPVRPLPRSRVVPIA